MDGGHIGGHIVEISRIIVMQGAISVGKEPFYRVSADRSVPFLPILDGSRYICKN